MCSCHHRNLAYTFVHGHRFLATLETKERHTNDERVGDDRVGLTEKTSKRACERASDLNTKQTVGEQTDRRVSWCGFDTLERQPDTTIGLEIRGEVKYDRTCMHVTVNAQPSAATVSIICSTTQQLRSFTFI